MAWNDILYDKLSFEVKIHSGHYESVSTFSIIKVLDPEPLPTGFVSYPFIMTMIWTNLILGLFYRTLVFYNVWKTALDESTKLFACSSWLLGYALAISIDEPLHLYFGKSFCAIMDFISGLGIGLSWLGGVGIAWMRAIYIHHSTRVSVRENTAAVLIGFVTLVTIFGLRLFYYMLYTPIYPDFEPICLGRPIDDPLLDYNAPRSLDVNDERLAGLGFFLVITPIMLSEMAMYVSIFKFLIKHDKMMRLVLSDTTIKKRMKKNGIDLFGHAIIFFTEGSSFLIKCIDLWLAKGSSPTEMRNRRWMVKCVNMSVYGIASVLHIMMSSSLRADTIAIVRKLSLPF